MTGVVFVMAARQLRARASCLRSQSHQGLPAAATIIHCSCSSDPLPPPVHPPPALPPACQFRATSIRCQSNAKRSIERLVSTRCSVSSMSTELFTARADSTASITLPLYPIITPHYLLLKEHMRLMNSHSFKLLFLSWGVHAETLHDLHDQRHFIHSVSLASLHHFTSPSLILTLL